MIYFEYSNELKTFIQVQVTYKHIHQKVTKEKTLILKSIRLNFGTLKSQKCQLMSSRGWETESKVVPLDWLTPLSREQNKLKILVL